MINNPERFSQEELEMMAVIGAYNQRGKRIDMREFISPSEEAKVFAGYSVQAIREILVSLEEKGAINPVEGNLGYTLIDAMASDADEVPLRSSLEQRNRNVAAYNKVVRFRPDLKL